MKPHPIQIVLANNNDHSFTLDEEALGQILMQDEIKDRYVCVVSVAGAFRKGKSFLLDFFLRYMNSKVNRNHKIFCFLVLILFFQYVLKQSAVDWLGTNDAPLEGFSWRGGSERDTTGILMWSDIFLTELDTGEKVGEIRKFITTNHHSIKNIFVVLNTGPITFNDLTYYYVKSKLYSVSK